MRLPSELLENLERKTDEEAGWVCGPSERHDMFEV